MLYLAYCHTESYPTRDVLSGLRDAYVKFDKGKRQLILSGTSESIEQAGHPLAVGAF